MTEGGTAGGLNHAIKQNVRAEWVIAGEPIPA
jgi:hypothetical protein